MRKEYGVLVKEATSNSSRLLMLAPQTGNCSNRGESDR
jgi:hypothetical protein